MNQVHLHLILAHVPVVIIPLAALILAIAILRRIEMLKLCALILFVFSAAITLPIYFTGDNAEEAIEDSPQFSESIIEKHEESAETSLWIVSTLGLVSLTGLLFRRYKPSYYTKLFLSLVLLLSIASAVSLALTASLGGEISHPEAFK